MNSTTLALTDGIPSLITIPHGLGRTPSFVAATILCTSADAGINGSFMTPGQEVGIEALFDLDAGRPSFGILRDATNIIAIFGGSSGPGGSAAITLFQPPGAGTPGYGLIQSYSNFSLKIYWQ